ncbi:MAG: hypothetical protein MK384_01040 [SAR202 cluster bacterium]|nr:hypothetical protein [SAR202 cluster bacterium]
MSQVSTTDYSASSVPTDTYRSFTEGAATIDRLDVGRLRLAGKDAVDLLNRLSTNELMDLEIGNGLVTILTTNKGRIIDMLQVYRLEDELLVNTSVCAAGKVAEWIDYYTIMEDVQVEDITSRTTMVSIAGSKAEDALYDSNLPIPKLQSFISTTWRDTFLTISRTDFLGIPSYDIVAPAGSVDELWRTMELETADHEIVETVRIQNRVPIYGKELTEDYNPHDAGLIDYVSFSKGCYIGQEVITRLNTYDKVKKQLVVLTWSENTDVTEATRLMFEGKQVGVVTSAATWPGSYDSIGLGYVQRSLLGTVTRLETESGSPVEINTFA